MRKHAFLVALLVLAITVAMLIGDGPRGPY